MQITLSKNEMTYMLSMIKDNFLIKAKIKMIFVCFITEMKKFSAFMNYFTRSLDQHST